MKKVIKVLQINGYAIMNRGVEKFLLNIYKNIDRDFIQFDFLTPLKCRNDQIRDDIKRLGGTIHELKCAENKFLNKLAFFKLIGFLKKHRYDIVHINTGSVLFMALSALAAKIAKAPCIIVHSHNSADMQTGREKKTWKNRIAKPILLHCPDEYLACSTEAAAFMYPDEIIEKKQYSIIRNGIETEKFSYNSIERLGERERLNIKDEYVIGNIAQFINQKNHKYLIDIFYYIHQLCDKTILLLVGEGELKESIYNQVRQYNLEASVIFYGISNDIPAILSVMDVFVLPSLFEGLPIVGIEAQACGLRCFMSDTISKELDITQNIDFLSISEKPHIWAEAIVNYLREKNSRDMDAVSKVKKAEYDIGEVSKDILKLYLNYAK